MVSAGRRCASALAHASTPSSSSSVGCARRGSIGVEGFTRRVRQIYFLRNLFGNLLNEMYVEPFSSFLRNPRAAWLCFRYTSTHAFSLLCQCAPWVLWRVGVRCALRLGVACAAAKQLAPAHVPAHLPAPLAALVAAAAASAAAALSTSTR